MDLCYEVRLHELHERLFTRVRWCIAAITVAASTAAFVTLTSYSPMLVGISGVAITAVGILDALSDFAGKVLAHRTQRRRYLDLLSRLGGLSVSQIDAERHQIAKDDPIVWESLKMPAYNYNVRTHGHCDFVQRLNPWQWLLSKLV